MTGLKRPLSPVPSLDAVSTDALCRAVKRLQTYSSDAEDEQASGCGPKREYDEGARAGSLQRTPGARTPQEAQLHGARDGSAAEQHLSQREHPREHSFLVAKRLLASRAAGPLSSTQQFASGRDSNQREAGRTFRTGGTLAAASSCQGFNVQSLKEPLEEISLGPAGAHERVVEPGTPVREEDSSPTSAKGFRLGTLGSDPPKSDNYALLYEEANMMLKNLHFARLQRHALKAPS